MLDFLIDSITVGFERHIFNKLSASQWKQNVPLSLSIFFSLLLSKLENELFEITETTNTPSSVPFLDIYMK
jgi:hypothetical protein